VYLFTYMQNKTQIDDVLGVWPLHGVCGAWGGIAAGIFGQQAFWGLGGVSFGAQVMGTLAGIVVALAGALVVYGVLSKVTGLRLSEEDEFNGADLSIHKISSINED
ncbi:ammonium transporter, partial [Vibrio splendidus]